MQRLFHGFVVCVALVGLMVAGGCATTGESAEADTLTQHVGTYPPPPLDLRLQKVGVPTFLDVSSKEKAKASTENLGALAADQLTTLAVNSDRFDVIERAQLEQLMQEQGLEGIVDPRELAQPGRVKGVDYLLIGKITNFRVKLDKSETGFGLAQVTGQHLNVGALDLKTSSTKITVDCGVDLRLVNPTDGRVVAAQFGEYKKTDTGSAFGMDLLGASATAEGDLSIDEDDQGKILRLALDHALRKMLPKMDRKLLAYQRQQEAAANKTLPSTPK